MPIITVDAEVDIACIETDDLVEELLRRLRMVKKTQSIKKYPEVVQAARDILLMGDTAEEICIKTLDDKMKLEHIAKVFGKYSSSQIEKLLPE